MKHKFKIHDRQKQFATCDWVRENLPRDTYYFWRSPAHNPNEVYWVWEFRNEADAVMCRLSVR